MQTLYTWHHVSDLSIKLNRANALLFKMRKYVFDSYLFYCCLVWAQNFNTIQRILILQKKTVRIINFPTKEFPYQSHIQAKLHLKIPR